MTVALARRIAAAVLSRTELASAILSVIYICIIAADMVLGEVFVDACKAAQSSAMQLWTDVYTISDLSFLSLFACETCLRVFVEGRAYFRSPLNSIDSVTVTSSLVLAIYSMSSPEISSFPLLRLFRLTRIVKMVGAYNRLVAMRDRWRTNVWKKRVQDSERRSTLVWSAGGTPVELSPPSAGEKGFHLFLSHKWAHAQDNAIAIKGALSSLVPSCRIFLDVDDLESMDAIEKHVAASDVVVVFVTANYLRSPNCRRELVEALRRKKPLVLLVDCDPEKGGTTPVQLRAEIEVAETNGKLPAEDLEA